MSRLSERAVEPTRSQKTAVISFRSSAGAVGSAASSGDPQARQNLATSGLSCPHLAQTGMTQAYGGEPWASSRGGQIRTADLPPPKRTRYQAALRPDCVRV